jgi:polysaccharide biosynthesis transport protein
MEADRELALRDYARVVVRRKWIVVIAVAVASIAALGMALTKQPIYAAESQVLVEPRAGSAVFQQDPTLNVQNLERAIATEIQVMEGQTVRQRVRDDLGLPGLPAPANARAVGSTDVVSLTVRSPDPRRAQVLADAYVQAYSETRRDQAIENQRLAETEMSAKIADLQTQIDAAPAGTSTSLENRQAAFEERLDQMQIDAALTTGGTSVVKSADLPSVPVAPRPVRSTVLAAFVGLLVGLAAAFLIDHRDDSVRTAEDLVALTDIPVLGVVPVKPPPDNRPIALSEPHEAVVEVYRGLRTNVQFLGLDGPLRIIQVTSSIAGEGKTTTAANLAVVLAQAGNRVAVVDGDLRKPRLHEVFSVPEAPGLTELLLGAAARTAINRVDVDLDLVTAGAVPPNPSEMLSSKRIRLVLAEIANHYDYVIVDSAPILPVADSVALSQAVDGVLLVTQANRTGNRDVVEALERLERVGAPMFGIVLNQAKSGNRSEAYGYRYRYGHPAAPAGGPAAPDDAPPMDFARPPAAPAPELAPTNFRTAGLTDDR